MPQLLWSVRYAELKALWPQPLEVLREQPGNNSVVIEVLIDQVRRREANDDVRWLIGDIAQACPVPAGTTTSSPAST